MKWLLSALALAFFTLHGCSPSGEVELSKEENDAHKEFLSHGMKMDKVQQGAGGGGNMPQSQATNKPSG